MATSLAASTDPPDDKIAMLITETTDKQDKYLMVKHGCLWEDDITRGVYEASDLMMVLLWHFDDCLWWRCLQKSGE